MKKQSWKSRQTTGPLLASLSTLCPEFFLKYTKRQPHLKKVFRRTIPVDFDARSNPSSFHRLGSDMKGYAGIGSRTTPRKILALMEEVGCLLASLNIELHSGGAEGADKTFEHGCDSVSGLNRIWLPWKVFNGSTSLYFNLADKASKLQKRFILLGRT